jgi:flavin reductase (DIM6/NTAB) family NADH-FMN oxidoreductase RutF
MRTFPQGVVVVTAIGSECPRGITVSSFTSLSLAPPRVLVSIAKESRAHEAIEQGRFAVSVLAEDHGALSDHFARRNTSEERFQASPSGKRRSSPVAFRTSSAVGGQVAAETTLFIEAEAGNWQKPLVFFCSNISLGSRCTRD